MLYVMETFEEEHLAGLKLQPRWILYFMIKSGEYTFAPEWIATHGGNTLDEARTTAYWKCRRHVDWMRVSDVALVAFGEAIDPLPEEEPLHHMTWEQVQQLNLEKRTAAIAGEAVADDPNPYRRPWYMVRAPRFLSKYYYVLLQF